MYKLCTNPIVQFCFYGIIISIGCPLLLTIFK